MARLNLSAPWVQYYHELSAMFKNDHDIKILYDEDKDNIKMYVADAAKAAALEELLPKEKTFGNVIIKITIIPGNKIGADASNIFETAFNGNPALCYTYRVDGIFTNPIIYVVFENAVVQYFTDDLGDINGVRSTLYQDIAKEIFVPMDGVYYCTDVLRDSFYY